MPSYSYYYKVKLQLSLGRFISVVGLGLLYILESTSSKVHTGNQETLDKIFKYVDDHEVKFIDDLRQAVAIPSVSCAPDKTPCFKMVDWTKLRLDKLGFTTELRHLGFHVVSGFNSTLPPILLGTFGTDPKKKTLLVYGHLDVQPAHLSDGWDTDPFKLTESNGNLYGRGSSDDKGPIIAWLSAFESYLKNGLEVPVNVKVVFEAMEECGSVGLEPTLKGIKDTFLNKVDLVTITDTYWIGTEKPCLVYGLRGSVYFHVEVEGGLKDLHSGQFGGATFEAMNDLIWLLDQMVDNKGEMTIPGIMDDVLPLTEEEGLLYENVEFDIKTFQEQGGFHGLRHKTKDATLMSRWRYPSLSIHGIEGAFSEPGSKTVIPGKVIGKFSIRLVNNQQPDVIGKIVADFLELKWKERGSPNKFKVSPSKGAKPWLADFKHPNYVCAATAFEIVYGQKPQYTREGGTIPITVAFQEFTGKHVMHLPLGQSNDGPHAQNEKISKRNFLYGIKLLAAYMEELGKNSDSF